MPMKLKWWHVVAVLVVLELTKPKKPTSAALEFGELDLRPSGGAA